MAENVVEIVVRSVNDTRKGFEAAKADAEKAGDSAGYSFGYAFQRRVSGMMMGLAGAGGGGAGGEATFLETFGSQFGMLAAGALVAAPAVAAVVTEVVALASGFAAAATGAGAFALFALPAFKQLQGDASSLVNLWDSLQTAQNKLTVAQGNYAADPTKANASALAAAQRGLLNAQNNLQAAQMGMGQDAGGAATAVLALRTEYDKLSNSLQDQAFKVLADALQAVTKFLPALAPMATAFANALDPLLTKLGAFATSKGFQDWLTKFDKIIGPAVTAIGEGVGKLVIAIGKLFTVMSSHDVVHAINILFDFLAGFFNILARWIQGAMNNWDRFSGSVKEAWANIKRWTDDFVNFFVAIPGEIAHAFDSLGDMLYRAGVNAVNGLIRGINDAIGPLSGLLGFFGIHIPGLAPIAGSGGGGSLGSAVASAANALGTGSGPGSGKIGLLAGSHVQLEVVSGGSSAFENFMVEAMRNWVRIRGGGGPKSVQIALGQTH